MPKLVETISRMQAYTIKAIENTIRHEQRYNNHGCNDNQRLDDYMMSDIPHDMESGLSLIDPESGCMST